MSSSLITVADERIEKMPEKTQALLNEILKNTSATAERTRNIERELASFQQRYETESTSKDKRISDLENQTSRNSLILSALIAFLTITYSAFALWVFSLL